MEQLVFSSLPRVLLPPFYTSSPRQRLALKLLRPWQRLFWGGVEDHIAQQLHFDQHDELYPTLTIEQDLFYGGQILESSWDKILDGQETGESSSSSSSNTQPGTTWLSRCGACFGGEKLVGSSAAASVTGRARVAGSAGGKQGLPGNHETIHVTADSSSDGNSDSSNIVEPGAAAAQCKQAKQEALQSDMGAGAGLVTAKVKAMQGMMATFTPDGVRLVSGEHVPADIVLYCTGYTKSYDYLEGSVKVSRSRGSSTILWGGGQRLYQRALWQAVSCSCNGDNCLWTASMHLWHG